MMTVYLRVRENGQFATQTIAYAKEGFDLLGIPTQYFTCLTDVPLLAGNMVVSFVSEVRLFLERLGVSTPDIDYPEELSAYWGRNIQRKTLASAEV